MLFYLRAGWSATVSPTVPTASAIAIRAGLATLVELPTVAIKYNSIILVNYARFPPRVKR
jgi:hypothetical protein